MKKRGLTLLFALLLALAPLSPGAQAQEEEAMLSAKSLLTEVYGYSYEEAENGFDYRVAETETERSVTFWPKEHPQWVYSASFDRDSGECKDGATPFGSGYSGYPGEGTVRWILSTAEEKDWFRTWDQTARDGLLEMLTTQGVTLEDGLESGLAAGGIGAAEAVQAFFTSCYGGEGDWPPSLFQWRDEVLAQNGLTLEKKLSRPEPGITAYTVKDRGTNCTVTLFNGETPEELAQAFGHPKLEGWTCLSGAMRRYGERTMNNRGLAAFGRDDDRLLVMLTEDGDGGWRVLPVGEKALLKKRDLFITCDVSKWEFGIVYPISDVESERFVVSPGFERQSALCRLTEYRRMNVETGEGVVIDGKGERMDAGTRWYHATIYSAGAPAAEEIVKAVIPEYLDFIDAEAFPKDLEGCRAAGGYAIPEGIGVASNVHLRAKTSSRSKDLGTYEAGTLVRVLELLPGDPSPWVHVQIGLEEGYMSGAYVQYEGTDCAMKLLEQYKPLTVAANRRPTSLKKGTGWLEGTAAELEAGTKMHVLCERGDWLYVVVPRDEISWLMDLDGTYGYVRATDVEQAATAIQLDWME